MDSPTLPPAAPRRRRSFRKLSAAQLATVHWALTRSTPPPATAAAVADVFGLDVSSVHRIRRTYRPPAPVETPERPIAFWPWRQRTSRRSTSKRPAPLPIF
jgi:hypothetical protein